MSNGSWAGETSKKQSHQFDTALKSFESQTDGVKTRTPSRINPKARVQDEILLLLSNKSLHGYSIWNIVLTDYPEMRLNTLYRWMNDLEARGLIDGIMEQGVRGPKRKVYDLTENGKLRVVFLIRNAVKLMTDIYRRYRLFSALHFSNVSQLAELAFSDSRALIASFSQFADFDFGILQSLVEAMRGRRIDFLGPVQGISKIHHKPRLLKGNIQSLSAKSEVYGDIWLIGVPRRSSFGPTMKECKRTLMKDGTLFLAIPFLISSCPSGSDFGSFMTNTLVEIFPELEIMEFCEIESILKNHFKEFGVLDFGIHVLWAKK